MKPASWWGRRPWSSSPTWSKQTSANLPWDIYSVSLNNHILTEQWTLCLYVSADFVLIKMLRWAEGKWENDVSLSHCALLLHTGMAGAARSWRWGNRSSPLTKPLKSGSSNWVSSALNSSPVGEELYGAAAVVLQALSLWSAHAGHHVVTQLQNHQRGFSFTGKIDVKMSYFILSTWWL